MDNLDFMKRKNRFLHPAVCLPLAFALLAMVALYWYPPLWQPGYAPQNAAPFFEKALEGVDINHATAEELTALPGIGPKKARAIVEYREANGPFAKPDDLLLVNGIGPATLEGMLDDLVFVR